MTGNGADVMRVLVKCKVGEWIVVPHDTAIKIRSGSNHVQVKYWRKDIVPGVADSKTVE